MAYLRVSFQSVIESVAVLAGEDPTALNSVDLALIRRSIADRLEKWAWPAWPWPKITHCEKRRFRATYAAGTTYAAPTATSASEVWFPATRQYYQALRATTGNAPATVSGTTWTTNAAYWAVCGGPYNGSDWADATAYAVGATVRNTDDNRFYQCHTAHTSSGSFDATKFGILTDFDPYVAKVQSWETNEMGDVLGTYLDNPNAVQKPRIILNRIDTLGVHLLPTPTLCWGDHGELLVPGEVWVKFRQPPPCLRGADYSASATYTAGAVRWYASSTQDYEGDFWEVQSATSAGQNPETHPAKWTRQAFPAWLRAAVARRAYADWLRADGGNQIARVEDLAADDDLFQAQLQAGSQQGQVLRWRMSA